MKANSIIRAAILATGLFAAAALAQPVPPSGNCGTPSATCKAGQFSLIAGNQLCLNSTTCTTWVQASVATGGMRLNSGVADSGANAAYSFDTTATLSGSTLIFNIGSGGVQQASLTDDGIWFAESYQFTAAAALQIAPDGGSTSLVFRALTAGTFLFESGQSGADFASIGASLATFAGEVRSSVAGFGLGSAATTQGIFASGGNDVIRVASTGNTLFVQGNGGSEDIATMTATLIKSNGNPVPVVHAAQTAAAVAQEFGRAAASAGGVLAVTFATAFASAPTCVCTDENAVPVICGITTAPITTAVTFSITAARADTIDWYCIGAK